MAPKNPWYPARQGQAYQALKDYDSAIESFEKALTVADSAAYGVVTPTDKLWFHYEIGTSYFLQGDNDKALAKYKEIIAVAPDYANAYFAIGRAYQHADRNNEAIAAFKEAIRLNPQDIGYHHLMAWSYCGLRKYDKAILEWQRVLAMDAFNIPARMGLGHAYSQLKRWAEARQKYNEVLKLQSGHWKAGQKLEEIKARPAEVELTLYIRGKNE